MKHTIKLLTLAAILTAVFGLTGCPGPVNNYIDSPVWDDGVVTLVPTCTEEGVKTYTCSNGETRTETIPALGHDFGEWSNWTTTIEVAYNHDGEKEHTRTCRRCGHSETVEVTISRFVAGGYDGDIPINVENAETYRYQYTNGIKFHLFVTTQEKYNEKYVNYTITSSSDIWDDYYLSFENENSLPNGVFYYDVEDGMRVNMIRLLGLKNLNHNSFKYGVVEHSIVANSTRSIGYRSTYENNFYIVLN